MDKQFLTLLATISLIFAFSGCTTPVAIDPISGQEQTASFSGGTFTGPLNATPDRVFRRTIRVMDETGYFRTGEVHRENRITIYARRVGDQRVTVRIERGEETPSVISIRIGATGNLAESQVLYAKIREAL